MVLKFDSAAGNPARALPEWPPVVVAGGYITGVVLMRNLQHRGVDTHCIDSNPAQPAFLTKYGKAHLCPNPDLHPAEWVQFMIELSKSLGRRPVLIPSADQFVTALGTHLDELEPHFTFSRSSVENQTRLATKEQQYELAGQHGLPVPRSEFIHSLEELQRFSSTARFPCLLKPTHFREWERVPRDHPLYGQKIAMADNPAELEAKYRLACDASPLLVAQEIIEGPDTAKYAYLSCYGSNGERIGTCLVRQIRCWPIYWGSGSVVENIIDPEVDQLCDRFLRSIGYIGLCEIELKRDTRDGVVKMIEANPRYSVTSDAAPYAGVDLGWLHYLDLIGQPVNPVAPSSLDFRHIFLIRDYACFRDYLRDGLVTWGGLIHSYRRPRAFFDFDLHDWRVTAYVVNILARTLLVPLVRKVFPKRK